MVLLLAANKTVSIQDIAQVAGVSHTTVSRALRNSPLISQEVREQIQELAREMGYIPNAVAPKLARFAHHTIGLVVTTIADPFVGRVVRVLKKSHKNIISAFSSVSQKTIQNEKSTLSKCFHRRRVDGLIVAAARLDANYEKTARAGQRSDRTDQPANRKGLALLHTVSVDDYFRRAHGRAASHRLGHRKIGYLGAGNRPRSKRVRLTAYRDAWSAPAAL
jgi:LacI family transcriptional regulator/LacI family repressor for deo operon, udp, cdd, tsx, nupC, and nupG